jgi:hypothetical protein
MFKLQISLDRHNAGLKFNYCLRFDPHHFSLPSTYKGKTCLNSCKKARKVPNFQGILLKLTGAEAGAGAGAGAEKNIFCSTALLQNRPKVELVLRF